MFRFFEQRNSSCEDAKIVVNSSRNSCDFDVNVMMRGGREGVGFRRLKGTRSLFCRLWRWDTNGAAGIYRPVYLHFNLHPGKTKFFPRITAYELSFLIRIILTDD